ncbi:GNAT family N-acetyltransferase [Streptomyces sp. p1417]|uniref:GNAT family N-acetyltransferase n=1 Tax=Streptomyces typhae TaxID=2681492 RepID=A0A6L6WV62_9ACTN|nr:GNAT family N-acetyltransferase [Streptomyces typhae]MVO84236.1 GNAT family N-acetyltransferase [Streptomyces typhae]
MSLVRRAVSQDAEEVIRLRQVMIDSVRTLDGTPPSASVTDWQEASLPTLRRRLADPEGDFAVFAVDHPERPGGLAAIAVGTLEYRIGRSGNPHGVAGYVFSVATDPGTRRRGFSRACVAELIAWFRERGAGQVDLTTSADAEGLYASLGFVRKPDPSMQLKL